MKQFYLLLVLVCLTTLSYSQLRMAVIGGHHSASVNEKNSIPTWETLIKPGYSSRGGFSLGLMLDLPVSSNNRWHFQPSLTYTEKGRKFYMKYDTATSIQSDTISASYNLGIDYIEIPLNMTFKAPLSPKVNFFIGAGPYIGLFYGGKQKYETRLYSSNSYKDEAVRLESGNAEGKFKTIDAGFNARAGLELGKVILSGFMSQGFTNFYTASYTGTFKHQVRGVTLGIWLNKAKPARTPKTPLYIDKNNIPGNDAIVVAPVPESTIINAIPDTDDDGVADNIDNCPEIPGVQKFGGCPVPDTDGDGINDEADACPTEKGVVEFNGCPVPDSDGDGLNDVEDKCPSEPGSKTNNGCPEIKPATVVKQVVEIKSLDVKNILFLSESSKLTAKAMATLDGVANKLTENPVLKLKIEGYTDATGNDALNLRLSNERAEIVKNYLMDRGIDASRLTAKGYGSSKPLQSNKTVEGRKINRRVEIKLAQ